MSLKTKFPAASQAPSAGKEPKDGFYLTPPGSFEERIHRIETMGERITGYVQYMSQLAGMNGTSAEAKERGVAAFYERLVVVESQLRRIHDELRLE